MGTPLQTLYDRFQIKLDENLTGKENIIFGIIDSAIAKSYKTCRHSLSYELDEPIYDDDNNQTNLYEGNFIETLDNDEIELLALWMKYEWNWREQQRLLKQEEAVGTSSFNRLPNKKDQLMAVNKVLESVKDEIEELTNEFNTYMY